MGFNSGFKGLTRLATANVFSVFGWQTVSWYIVRNGLSNALRIGRGPLKAVNTMQSSHSR